MVRRGVVPNTINPVILLPVSPMMAGRIQGDLDQKGTCNNLDLTGTARHVVSWTLVEGLNAIVAIFPKMKVSGCFVEFVGIYSISCIEAQYEMKPLKKSAKKRKYKGCHRPMWEMNLWTDFKDPSISQLLRYKPLVPVYALVLLECRNLIIVEV